MPTAYTVTPEPVTNSGGRGWGVVSAEEGRREGEEGGGRGRNRDVVGST